MAPYSLDLLTCVTVDRLGRLAMTAVVDLEYWRPLTYLSDGRFLPGTPVALCKQTDDVLTGLAVDRDGRLVVTSVARIGIWNTPVAISTPLFPPGAPVAMAKQTAGVLTALAVDSEGRLSVASVGGLGTWNTPVPISDARFAPATPVAMAKQTTDILTALAVDVHGRLNVASVAALGTWQAPVTISEALFRSSTPVVMAKQTDDVLTALAVDAQGRLTVASVAGLGAWNPPVGISGSVFVPASPIAMAKQTDDVLTALGVDANGRLAVASVAGLGTWNPPVAISDSLFVPGSPVALAKQTPDVLTAAMIGADGRLHVASVAGLGTWSPPVAITDPVLPAKGAVALAKQVEHVDLERYLAQQPPVSGSAITQRIAQLTGGFDPEFHHLEVPVNRLNQTGQHGVAGVDLGTNAELNGRLFFFCGDVPTSSDSFDDQSDWVAFTTDQSPSDIGIRLTSVDRPGGSLFQPFSIAGIGPLGIGQTPTGAFAYSGADSGRTRKQMFVFAFYKPATPTSLAAGSVLTKTVAPESGAEYQIVFSFSTFAADSGRFFQVAPHVIRNADLPGLPARTGDGLLMLGHGGPINEVHLAWMPLTPGEDPVRSRIRFFTGNADRAAWSPHEVDAVPLFWTVGYTSLSLHWLSGPRRWLLLYSLASPGALGTAQGPGDPTQHNPNGPVVARLAKVPWAWSEPIIIFDPLRDNALGRFMHRPGDTLDQHAPVLPRLPAFAYDGMPGYAYGPFALNGFTEWDAGTRTLTLYYLMSTFAPYQIQLMRSRFEVSV